MEETQEPALEPSLCGGPGEKEEEEPTAVLWKPGEESISVRKECEFDSVRSKTRRTEN